MTTNHLENPDDSHRLAVAARPREVAVQWRPHRRPVPVEHAARRPLRTRVTVGALLAAAAGLGCASTVVTGPLEPGVTHEVVLQGPTASAPERRYRVRVPRNAPEQARARTETKASALPAVVILHGAFSSPERIETHSGWSELADEEGFIALYPEGIGLFGFLQHWNAGHCCGKALADDVDDVGFVLRVLDDAAARWPIDRQRVYVTGFSNGAMLAHRVAAEAPGSFAALAAVAGPPAGRSRPLEAWWKIPQPEQPVPALLVFGKADRTVPWKGRLRDPLRFPPALYSARLWAERNGCDAKPERSRERDGRIETFDYPGCDAGAVVRMKALEDWGHRWPAPFHTGRLAEGDPLHDFDATREIWSFFRAFERRSTWPEMPLAQRTAPATGSGR